jgi:bifunctional DNA-binding transcriptional regulator/antitoxin component of YhaV-PrlF toxin-antitoxin module
MAGKVKGRLPGQRSKVSSKNQITLPVAALAEAHVRPGDVLRVEVIADGEFRLVRERSRLDAVIGTSPGVATAANLDAERDSWER